jgi:large repetitive protein
MNPQNGGNSPQWVSIPTRLEKEKTIMNRTSKSGVRALVTSLAACGLLGLSSAAFAAGNVTAILSGSDLNLLGDAAANSIRVQQDSAGAITITGFDGTTINGQPAVIFGPVALTKLEAKMEAGDDRIEVFYVTSSGDITIDAGDGWDAVAPVGVTAGDNIDVYMGSGTDRDYISAHSIRTLRGDVTFDTAAEYLGVALNNSTIAQTLSISSKDGDDSIRLNTVSVGADLAISTDKGRDVVVCNRVNVRYALSVSTDLDADRVDLFDTTAGEDVEVNTGDGNDLVNLRRLRSDKNIKISTDAGNDRIVAQTVLTVFDGSFVGGAGTDSLTGASTITAGKREILEFETVSP